MTRSRDYAPQAPSIGRFKIVGPNPIGFKAPSYLVLDTNVVIAIGRLAFKGPSSPSQISEETEISPGTVRPALRSLLSKKYVTQRRDGAYSSKIAFTDIISDIYQNYVRK